MPSAPTLTMPECSATSTEVGGGVPSRDAAAVAAGAQRAGHALHRVDQQAVEVADLDAELALAEDTSRPGSGVWKLVRLRMPRSTAATVT